jgi:membrane-associated phospholipid phosphatase
VTVTLRLFSGVHWLTDIVGGVLLGGVIVALYGAACAWLEKRGEKA